MSPYFNLLDLAYIPVYEWRSGKRKKETTQEQAMIIIISSMIMLLTKTVDAPISISLEHSKFSLD
jgi:hypothetical protein